MATTKTSTFTRIDAVKLQFKHALCYAADIDEKYIDLLLECIENHYIESFNFYGLNNSNQCEVELEIKIDWLKYQVAVSIDENVCIKSGKNGKGVSVIIYDWVENYLKVINGKRLRKKYSFVYSSEVMKDKTLHDNVTKLLNSRPSPPIVYAQNFKTSLSIPVFDLPEISMRFKCEG